MYHIRLLAAVVTTLVCAYPCHAQKRIKVLGWNVEARGSQSDYIADQIDRLEGFDILGLCEVNKNDFEKYRRAAMAGEGAKDQTPRFFYIPGTTGDAERYRLLIIYDDRRFDKLGVEELDEVEHEGHRAPLVAHFRLKETDHTFKFMVNHLARGDGELRSRQAAQLRDWAASQEEPIIAVGDYNFDFEIDEGKGNDGFNNMIAKVDGNRVFHWIRPPELFKSQLSGRYYSVLDFVFIANKPDNWDVSSRVLVDGFGPIDTDETSDHRPVQARIFIDSQ